MRLEHLKYFRELLEGRAEISWHAWFQRHRQELEAELPRADFLRLRFHHLDEAERQLRAGGIDYTPDPAAARRERYYALLHPSVLDERGRPLESFRRAAYEGARGQIMDGDLEGARSTLAAYVRKVRRYRAERRAEALEELAFDGEMELTLGDPAAGRLMLEAVASVPEGDDLRDPAIRRAKELLQEADTNG